MVKGQNARNIYGQHHTKCMFSYTTLNFKLNPHQECQVTAPNTRLTELTHIK